MAESTPQLAIHKPHITSQKVRPKTNSQNTKQKTMSGFPVEMPAPTQCSFVDALISKAIPSLDSCDGKMLTENGDITFRTSGSALVDAFFELEDVISGTRLSECLDKAWTENPEATLRIIWNARSIHLGKGSRNAFYRAMGWLAERHPQTLLANLPWLVRPLTQKKASKKDEKKTDGPNEVTTTDEKLAAANDITTKEECDDAVMVDESEDSEFEPVDEKMAEGSTVTTKKPEEAIIDSFSEFDVKYGVAHGYWKDLLNILSLAANNQLKADGDPRKVFNIDNRKTKKRTRDWTEDLKKTRVAEQHDKILKKLDDDEFYKSLHNTVAGLFAEQLKLDTARLESESKADKKRITLAAKWAPSQEGSHDNQTFIVSTIAELLHSFEDCCPDSVDTGDRKQYLKHARIAYQSKTLSPLRKFLRVVERDITAEKFENIMYERVPSLAMKQLTSLFIRKDEERFEKYIDGVADGKMRISGATLLPSTLVAATSGARPVRASRNAYIDQRVKEKEFELTQKTIDGQWKTLVQRIKDSGTLESSLAVCDVSGSMSSPRFPDGTCPMDSSTGLSLLVAEITAPPFGGAFITFSSKPTVVRVGGAEDQRTLVQKVRAIRQAEWDMSTDFVAVFERLILPMAIEHKVKKEDMVKQVFVFSDMQFDSADYGSSPYGYSRQHSTDGKQESWSTSYERVKARYAEAGYDMPRLIFWNLAGGRAGMQEFGDDTAPKPVQAHEENTALVSGYSQGQMKMFLDNGSFADPEAEEEIKDEVDDDGDVVVEKVKGKQDPMAVVKKALMHEAYRMLRVVD